MLDIAYDRIITDIVGISVCLASGALIILCDYVILNRIVVCLCRYRISLGLLGRSDW